MGIMGCRGKFLEKSLETGYYNFFDEILSMMGIKHCVNTENDNIVLNKKYNDEVNI